MASTTQLQGYVFDAEGDAKVGLTVTLYNTTDTSTALATDTTDSNGMWNFDDLDNTIDYDVKVTDGTKNLWIKGLTEGQVAKLYVTDNFQVGDSKVTIAGATGNTVIAGTLQATGNLYIFDAGGEVISGDGTDMTISSGGAINLTATTDVVVPSGVGVTFAGTEKIESDGTDLSITVGAGGDVNMGANIGLTFGDDGEIIEGDGTDLTIKGGDINLTAEGDINIPQDVGLTFGSDSFKIEADADSLNVTGAVELGSTLKLGGAVNCDNNNFSTINAASFGTDLPADGTLTGPREHNLTIIGASDGATARDVAIQTQSATTAGVANRVNRIVAAGGAAVADLKFSDVYLKLEERAAAGADTAGYGQDWVISDAPNRRMFTDDAGTDFALSGYFYVTKVIGDGVNVISTGLVPGDIQLPKCEIVSATALLDQSGSIVVDLWVDTYANYPPLTGDSICDAGTPLTIAGAVKGTDATMTSWTTSITEGQIMRFNVDSVATATSCTYILKCRRS